MRKGTRRTSVFNSHSEKVPVAALCPGMERDGRDDFFRMRIAEGGSEKPEIFAVVCMGPEGGEAGYRQDGRIPAV